MQTERGNVNRYVEVSNSELRQIKTRIRKLEKGLVELKEEAGTPPNPSYPIPSITLAEILTILLENPQEKGRCQKVADLKTVAKAIAFLQENGVTDMESLQCKVTDIRAQCNHVFDRLKKVERRMKTLGEYIHHAEVYLQHKHIFHEYKRLKPIRQNAFRQRYHAEITLCESVTNYLRGALNGRTSIPLKAWRAEASPLTSEKAKLYQEYRKVKQDVQEVETIRRSVEQAMRQAPEKEREKSRDAHR